MIACLGLVPICPKKSRLCRKGKFYLVWTEGKKCELRVKGGMHLIAIDITELIAQWLLDYDAKQITTR